MADYQTVPVISATTAKSHHIRDCSEEYAETITTSPGLVLGILARNVCGRHEQIKHPLQSY